MGIIFLAKGINSFFLINRKWSKKCSICKWIFDYIALGAGTFSSTFNEAKRPQGATKGPRTKDCPELFRFEMSRKMNGGWCKADGKREERFLRWIIFGVRMVLRLCQYDDNRICHHKLPCGP